MRLDLAALVLAALAPAARALQHCPTDVLSRPDSQPAGATSFGSNHGWAVDTWLDYALVGEPSFSASASLSNCGRVVLYQLNASDGTWTLLSEHRGQAAFEGLGASVAFLTSFTSGANRPNFAASSPGNDFVRVYEFLPGNSVSIWQLFDPAATGAFGTALAAHAGRLYVGEPDRGPGFVHVYSKSGGAWSRERFISVPLGNGSRAGAALAAVQLNGPSPLVVGAPNALHIDPSGNGLVLIYDQTGSTLQQTLEIGYTGEFGASLAAKQGPDGVLVVVGSPQDTVAGAALAGRAYVYRSTSGSYSLLQTLQDSSPAVNARFGASVALESTLILNSLVRNCVVGAPGPEGSTSAQGSALLFSRTDGGTFAFDTRFTSPTPANGRFGAAVAHGTRRLPTDSGQALADILVADPADLSGRGAVYAYRRPITDCNANQIADECDIASGSSVDDDADGVPDECESPTCLLEELNASNGAANDRLGSSVATDGVRVISGAPGKTSAGGATDAGAAFVYRRDGTHLVQEAILLGTNVQAADGFGACVAIEGDLAFVGSPGDDTAATDAGALYVFRRNVSTGGWALETKLVAPDAAAGAAFGSSVAQTLLLSDGLFVGAPSADTVAGPGRGKVYVFARSGAAWTHRNTLFDPSGNAGDAFGFSVAITYSTIAIGAPRADPSGATDAGAVFVGYVYSPFTNQVPLSKLAQSTPRPDSWLGYSVAVGANGLVAAGAPHDPTRGYIAGSVQLYYGLLSPALVPVYLAGGNDWDSFGTAVAWADDRLLASMPFIDTVQAPGAGQVCVYRFSASGACVESARISAPDGNSNQAFGQSVAWRDGLLACGAYGDDFPNGTDSGSAYAFGLGGGDCDVNGACDLCDIRAGSLLDGNQNGVPDGCEVMQFCFGDGSGSACPCGNESSPRSGGCLHSFGTAGLLSAAGSASVANDTLVLTASNMPATTTALFFQGTAKDLGGMGLPFADGLRCVTGAIVRLRTRQATNGSASYPIAADPQIHVRGGVLAGETRYYQAHYRNVSSTFCAAATSNYTNGVAAVWTP